MRRHLTFANIGVVVALVLATTGFALATIPGNDGVIHGCFNRKSGALRIIDSNRRCGKLERAIAWNQQGPPGKDAQFNGAAAGGDLTGTYPAPQIKTGAVDAGNVAPDSLTGNEIDESTLGQVPDSAKLGGVGAVLFSRTSGAGFFSGPPGSATATVAPGLSVSVLCVNSPATGNQVRLTNSTGHTVEAFIDDSRGLSGSTPFDDALANSGSMTTDIDTATNVVRRVTINVISPLVTAVVTVIRQTSPNGCFSIIHGLT